MGTCPWTTTKSHQRTSDFSDGLLATKPALGCSEVGEAGRLPEAERARTFTLALARAPEFWCGFRSVHMPLVRLALSACSAAAVGCSFPDYSFVPASAAAGTGEAEGGAGG